jgi:cytoskeletal protein CcmA (bactofilin family)
MTNSWGAALIAVVFAIVAPAHARDADPSGVVIDTDRTLVLAGGSVSPSKPVPANFIAAAGRIVVDQPVGKSAMLAGGSIAVRAPIEHNLRAAGGSIDIENAIGGNAVAAGGEVRVGRGAAIAGNARIFSGTITIDGTIGGSLKASAERIIINGRVAGNVKAAAEQIVLGPGASIGGTLQYVSDKEVVKGEGATIVGAVTRKAPGTKEADEEVPHVSRGAGIAGTVFSFLALLGLGAIFLGVAPIFSVEAPDRIKSTPWKSLGVGVLTVIGVPILAVLFILTIIGIPVGLMLLLLYPIALLLGFVVGTLFVGNAGAALLKRPPPPTIAAAIGYFAIALAVVLLVDNVPRIGGLLIFVVFLLGVGAFLVELYRRMKASGRAARVASARA